MTTLQPCFCPSKGLVPSSPHVDDCPNRAEIYLYTLENSHFNRYLGSSCLFTSSGFQNPKLLGTLFQNLSQLIVPYISLCITQITSVVVTPIAPQAHSAWSVSLRAWSVWFWVQFKLLAYSNQKSFLLSLPGKAGLQKHNPMLPGCSLTPLHY